PEAKENKAKEKLQELFKLKENMKFDAVVGNPPYQESKDNTRDEAIYNYFYDLSELIATKYCLISPARFLFNAGTTHKEWNQKMLKDEHIKVIDYKQDSSIIFPNTDIKGGVVILYRDIETNFGSINTFTRFKELDTILQKVTNALETTLDTIVSGSDIYQYSSLMHKENPSIVNILSKHHPNTIVTSALTVLDNIIFFSNKPKDNNSYVKILGRFKNSRALHWIREDYINKADDFNYYKVLVPKSNGTGAIGEVMSTPLIGEPLIGEPLIGFTQTFISIGTFENREEAENCLKYIKSKFARTMLGILKVTQHNPRSTWKYVPLQDFTANSDIDWSKTISEIDQQLYKKYELNEDEIAFIEEKVQPMD
ncbi:MAG: Eco57I restriction-modification methylase domain-containing protein, partial [Bacteroides sp.]|nr:Eco57I restriction-modification methylase domain-containing protein [Bacteroides sp.]